MSDLVGNPEDRFSRVEARITCRHITIIISHCQLLNEPVREKTNNLGFRPGPT